MPPREPGLHVAILLRYAASVVVLVYELSAYFVAFAGPALLLYRWRALPPLGLLALSLGLWYLSGILFLIVLIATLRVFIGVPKPGQTSLETAQGRRWFLAASLSSILDRSPFRSLVLAHSPVALFYYRAMGARIAASAFVGAFIFDPWFLEIADNAVIGAEALITGHVGQKDGLTLGKVVIRKGALVGGRALVFPDVEIGEGATVAAGAMVLRGTVIAPGETWGGVPAKRIQ